MGNPPSPQPQSGNRFSIWQIALGAAIAFFAVAGYQRLMNSSRSSSPIAQQQTGQASSVTSPEISPSISPDMPDEGEVIKAKALARYLAGKLKALSEPERTNEVSKLDDLLSSDSYSVAIRPVIKNEVLRSLRGEPVERDDAIDNMVLYMLAADKYMFEEGFKGENVELFNKVIRNSKSAAEATAHYWDSVCLFNARRKVLVEALETKFKEDRKYRDEMLEHSVEGTWMEGHVREQPEQRLASSAALLLVFLAGQPENNEASTISALEVAKVDERVVSWASNYVAWLRKDAAFKNRLFNSMLGESQAKNNEPVAFAEAFIRYSVGDSNFSSAWDQQQISRGQASTAIRECEAAGRELDAEAAGLAAECMKLRAALAKDYNTKFSNISVP